MLSRGPSRAKSSGDSVTSIADWIRNEIVVGVLKPGDRIYEAKLARQYGVARAPVREAARLLEREGLLVSQLNKGLLVRDLTILELTDLMDTRICVERHAIRTIVLRADVESLIGQLDAAILEISKCVTNKDIDGEVDADFRFHRLIVEFTGNYRLLSIYDQLSTELRISMRMISAVTDWENIPRLHTNVVDAIRSKDVSLAEDAMEVHIRTSWEETLGSLKPYLDVSVASIAKRMKSNGE
jgi:DNA-binding GntR family transcriptional regulator